MDKLLGIGKKDRGRLSKVIHETNWVIRVGDASKILGIERLAAAKILSRWSSNGWISRIYKGIYIPIPIESLTIDIPIEDPWLLIQALFSPGNIGGWSAAEYWDLTEQIFQTVMVYTTQKPRSKKFSLRNVNIVTQVIPEKYLFGLEPVWKGQSKILLSDPSRTIIDLMNRPKSGGGIRHSADIFLNYLKSSKRDLVKLLQYAENMEKGSIYKRLGFLLEIFAPEEKKAIEKCKKHLSKGYTKLDPNLPAQKIVTRWRLWVPDNWAKKL